MTGLSGLQAGIEVKHYEYPESDIKNEDYPVQHVVDDSDDDTENLLVSDDEDPDTYIEASI